MQSDLMGRDELLTQEETEDLIVGFLEHRDSASTEEPDAVVEWAYAARQHALIVDMVLAGDVVIKAMKGDEPLLALASKS